MQLDQCETQLEEIGGVLHEYARSHGDAYPESLSVIYTQLKGPKILLCPADSAHRPARSWESLGEQNLSFTYDGKGRSITNESDSILTCPIHDSYLTADGIVHPGTVPRSRRR